MTLPRWRHAAVALVALSLRASVGFAQAPAPSPPAPAGPSPGVTSRAPSPADKALAEALFLDGRKLMDAGDPKAACPKFEESHRLDPSGGTLLNLAVCHHKEGKTASAWVEFKEAASMSEDAGKPDRAAFARQRATELEAELSHLVLTLIAPTSGLKIHLDGAALSAAATIGTGIPVDPGEHQLEARATGKKTWSERVLIEPGPSTRAVTIPALEDEPVASRPSGAQRATPRPPTEARGGQGRAGGVGAEGDGKLGVPDPGNGGRPGGTDVGLMRTLGFVAGGVGLVGVSVGSVFGLMTFSHAAEAGKGCMAGDVVCGETRQQAYARGRTTGLISTVGFGAGVLGVGAGVALLVVSSRSASANKSGGLWVTPEIGAGGAHMTLGGRW
ncbi:hypothetical protein [Chondromyces crocatus]|uniref:PEGA domain-containing protein n=1 Tax=Chondromyces crocatus TaxID=52 RepID=A0A0K1EJ70_CHOCO|nr:hypothetical protein [Chondromyces crocatus]AKT40914.1 uncharacterized protein CMC5_050710 [Chondromyces crocatus]